MIKKTLIFVHFSPKNSILAIFKGYFSWNSLPKVALELKTACNRATVLNSVYRGY